MKRGPFWPILWTALVPINAVQAAIMLAAGDALGWVYAAWAAVFAAVSVWGWREYRRDRRPKRRIVIEGSAADVQAAIDKLRAYMKGE